MSYSLVPQYLSDISLENYNVHSYNIWRRADLHLPKAKRNVVALQKELLNIQDQHFLISNKHPFPSPHFVDV